MISNLDNIGKLAVLAAQAFIDYDDSNPEVGFSLYGKRAALNEVRIKSGVDFDIDIVEMEWKDEEYQKERKKYPCRICGKLRVKRLNKKTGKTFWGCVDFSDRRHKKGMKTLKPANYNDNDSDDNYWTAIDDMLFGEDLGPY